MSKIGFFISGILFYLPESFRYLLSWILTFTFFDLFRLRRTVMLENIKRAMPQLTLEQQIKIVRKHVFYIFYNFLEFCIFPHINEKWIKKNIIFDDISSLEIALKEGGALLLALHLGHGDMAISMLSHRGLPMFVISKHFKYKWLNDFWFGTRKKFGAQFIDPHGRNTSFDILKALKNKNAVIFVQDQYMGPPYGVETKFFGIDTGTACGLALFSLKTARPVIPVYCYRDDKRRTHIVSLERVSLDHEKEVGQTREQILIDRTQFYNSILEKIITQYPDQWLWIHRRWKKYWSDLP